MDVGELVENFNLFSDWQERYSYLIDLGRQLPALDDAEKNDETKVEGCMSQVWMVSQFQPDGTVTFRAESDASIVQGLIAVLLTVYSGLTPQEIVDVDIEGIFSELGLQSHISPNRRSGFFAMVSRIKRLAAQHAAATEIRADA